MEHAIGVVYCGHSPVKYLVVTYNMIQFRIRGYQSGPIGVIGSAKQELQCIVEYTTRGVYIEAAVQYNIQQLRITWYSFVYGVSGRTEWSDRFSQRESYTAL